MEMNLTKIYRFESSDLSRPVIISVSPTGNVSKAEIRIGVLL
jgi:hypothetical protein